MKTNKFSLSHYRLLSQNMGNLIPIQCVPVIPGDTLQGQNSLLLRMAPLVFPVMHPVQIRIDTWFVPYRVIDDEWENFITGANEVDSPQNIPVQTGPTKLGQYFDFQSDYSGTVTAFPFKAYNYIYNQRYRDQDLIPPVEELNQDIQRCAWEKDYYTTARPWPAKGPSVGIPVRADVNVPNAAIRFTDKDGSQRVFDSSGATLESGPGNPGVSGELFLDPNDMRTGMALQRYAEARARYGSRFTEYLRYLGITPSDSRLQEPELLSTARGMVSFSEVLQTSENTTPGESGVGDLYGHGIAGMKGRKWRRFFEEHGLVLSLLSVRPKSVYQNVMPREWLKKTREDYFQKELVHLGQQPVWAAEVFPSNADDYAAWGWQDRYSEYRFHPSTVQGEFRDVLNAWHLARDFVQAPVLNQDFVECAPSDRIFQTTTNDTMLIMANNSLVARRMLPKSPSPRIL